MKVTWKNDTRRVSASTTFGDLRRSCLRRFGGVGLEKPFSLKYLDEDGDLITIGNSEDLEEAFRVAKDLGRVLKVQCVSEKHGPTKTLPFQPQLSGNSSSSKELPRKNLTNLFPCPTHRSGNSPSSKRSTKVEAQNIDEEALKWMASRLAAFGVEKNEADRALHNSRGNFTEAASSLLYEKKSTIEAEDEDEDDDASTADLAHCQERKRSKQKFSCRKATKPNISTFLQEGNPDELQRLLSEGKKYVDNVSSKADEVATYLSQNNDALNAHWHRATDDIVRNARSAGAKLQKKFLKSARKSANKTYAAVYAALKKDANEEFYENLRVAVKDAKANVVKDMRTEARELVERAKRAVKRDKDAGATSFASSCPCAESSGSDDEQVKYVLTSVDSRSESEITSDDSPDSTADRATEVPFNKGASALHAMGFRDRTANTKALHKACGDVGRAVAILLSGSTKL